MRTNNKSKSVALRISPETDALWEHVAETLGLSKVALLEFAIRKVARQEGIAIDTTEKPKETDSNG